jgi:hypothetical protein
MSIKDSVKKFLQNFRIPKTVFGLALLAVGVYLKNETLITVALSIMGLGVTSKTIKYAQGADPLAHERQFTILAEMFRKKGKD